MKLNLQVLASANIKRKKPWPKFAWLGEEKESLFLLDRNRLSVLYLPSGKTTRKVPKLSPLLPQIVSLSTTANGQFLVCLLTSGDVAVWHKDNDMLRIIPGLSQHATEVISLLEPRGVECDVCLANDCTKLIVIFEHQYYYVWEKDPRQNVMTTREEDLQGMWSTVVAPDNITLPHHGQKEAKSHTVFYANKVLGNCCQYSVVFTAEEKLCVSTVLLRFPDISTYSKNRHPSLHAEWSNIQYPIQNIQAGCKPMCSKGSYVVRYSPDCQVLAVIVNQMSANLTSLLYISPLTETVVIADLKNCGTNPARLCEGREYWIADLAWTADSLFLTCMTRHGSLAIAPRLGEPLPLQSSGCSLDIGPTFYLPLHPLISLSKHHTGSKQDISMDSEHDIMKQHYSLATNPRLPMILCSDGYLVTVLHLPAELNCVSLIRGLVLESSQHMSYLLKRDNLNMTLADAYKMATAKTKGREKMPAGYTFETPPQAEQMSSLVSEDSLVGLQDFLQDMNSGKIVFGETEALAATPNASFSNMDSAADVMKHFEIAQRALFTAWGVVVSNNEDSSRDFENVTKYTLKNLTKLFSILLDCSGLEDVVKESITGGSSGSVQNIRVFKLLNLYKAIFHLVQFDALKHNLLPAILKFSHGTLDLILCSKAVRQQDPRVKTLLGCLAILKFTETMVDKVYVWVPSSAQQASADYEQAYLIEATHKSRVTSQKHVNLKGSKMLPSKRLCLSWKLLYKHCIHYQEKLSGKSKTSEQWTQITQLISQLQYKLQQLDVDLSPTQQHISTGDKLSLNGLYTQAIDAWQGQLKNLAAGCESKRVSKLCHAQLYTYLLRVDLKDALDLVDSLILQSHSSVETSEKIIGELQGERSSLFTMVTSTLRQQTSDEKVPCIRNKAVRKLVHSMARFMAAYFTNETLYVFPSHNPKALPPVHIGKPVVNCRILPLYHRDVTSMVRRCGLERVWTTERTLEYLMLSGLVWEGVWFADSMGDWKSAFLLSVACKQHKKVAPNLYESAKISMQLPERLFPGCILERALAGLIGWQYDLDTQSGSLSPSYDVLAIDERTDLLQLSQTFEDIFTAGIMSMVDVAPWLVCGLVQRLKSIVCQFQSLVPADFYLPSPPIYCPQPAFTPQDSVGSVDAEEEKRLRFAASSVTQLILVVLEASQLSLPLLRWYIKDLTIAQSRAAQFKATTEGPLEELPDILNQHYSMPSVLMSKLESPAVQTCMTSFRDFCSLQWLVHSRDKLSMLLRKREKYLSNLNYEDYLRSNWIGEQEEEWLKECFISLQWAVNLLPFTDFLPEGANLYKVVLSLLIELPPCEDTADILAEHLHNSDNLDPDVQEKLAVLLKQWQGIIVKPEEDGRSARDDEDLLNDSKGSKKSVTFLKASPRGKTLSIYFEKQCQTVVRLLKKKAKCFGRYDQFVFSSDQRSVHQAESDIDLFIGGRPFETKQSFMEFLDTFSAVCFSKLVDNEAESSKSSLPLLEPFAREVKRRELQSLAHKIVNSVHQRQSLAILSTPRQKSQADTPLERARSKSSGIYPGLDRSKSVTDTSSGVTREKSVLQRCVSEGGLGIIEEQNETDEPYSFTRKSPGKTKMTVLASKFSQSDDILYKKADTQENAVSLDIDFGVRYSSLQSLLEWLTRWANKQHNLVVGEHDSLQPKVRIHIPPQLVVLALWLVENKYSSVSEGVRSRSEDLGNVSQKEQNGDLTQNLTSASAVTENIRSRTRKLFKQKGERKQSILSENVDEETLVHNAYAGVLERTVESEYAEDNSTGSEDVSTELQNSLSVVISGGSPMRSLDMLPSNLPDVKEDDDRFGHTLDTVIRRATSPVLSGHNFPHTHGNSSRSHRSQSPKPAVNSSQTGLEPSLRQSVSPGRTHGSHTKHRRSSHPSRREKGNAQEQGDSDLATQLQRVVRGELRRLMEVQHQSMMAMIGALDDTVQPESPRSRTRRSPISGSPERSLGTMKSDELKGTRLNCRGQKNHDLQSTLSELNQLQVSSNHQEDNLEYISPSKTVPNNSPGIPKFLRMSAERDVPVKFPPITEPTAEIFRGMEQFNARSPVQIPLLKLSAETAGLSVLKNLSNFPKLAHLPPPGYFSSGVDATPQRIAQLPSVRRYSESQEPDLAPGFPLLRLDLTTHPHLNQFNTNALGEETDKKEAVKQKLAQEFYQQQLNNWEQHNQDKFGKQFLRVDFGKLDTQRPAPNRDNEKRRRRREKESAHITETTTESEDNILVGQERVSSDLVSSASSEKLDWKRGETKTHSTDITKSTSIKRANKNEKAEVEKEDIHDGYAIPQGIFESYLKFEEEFGDQRTTNAKFQYETSKAVEKQRQERKKVDFATMTKEQVDAEIETDLAERGIRTAEASTSVTKDTGTDPIQEALIEYNRCIQGNVLAPDIYLGLRFGEDQDAVTQTQVSEPSRGYLNVVDIRASSVLRDLEGYSQQLAIQPDITLQPTSVRTPAEFTVGAREEELRENLSSPQRVGGDSLTLRLFNRAHRTDDSMTAAVYSGAKSRDRSRESVIRQLRNMDCQLRAIDNMSNSMQKDLDSTKLLLSTIENVGEVLHPDTGDISPKSAAGRSSGEIKHSSHKDDTTRSSLTPIQSEKSPQRSVRSQAQSFSQSPTQNRDSGPSMDVKVSGLSGITDIIGDMLAEGGIDLAEAGLSPEEARQLTRRTAKNRQAEGSGFDSIKMSVEKLQQIANEAGLNANKRGPEEKKALQDWMTERRHKQFADYKKQRRELQENERHPFIPSEDANRDHHTNQELIEAEKQRESNRKTMAKENVEKRFLQATQLLGEILSDEPKIPQELPAGTHTSSPKSARFARKMQTRIITPRGGTSTRPSTAPLARNSNATAWEQSTLSNSLAKKTFRISDHTSMYNRPPMYDDDRPIRPMTKPFLEEPEELPSSREVSGHLAKYGQVMESLETITEVTARGAERDTDNTTEPDMESTAEPYRPKPFTDLVRLQRPEITRKEVIRPRSPALSESPRSGRHDSISKDSYNENGKEKLYGSKHIPGASKRTESSPRRVKTYTERLQDMKASKRVYSTPIVPHQSPPKTVTSNIPRPKWRGPIHKPMTYTQQLQQLSNRSTFAGRGTGGNVYVRPKVGIKYQGPRHKPQTYTQQLQKLNQQAPKTTRTSKGPTPDIQTYSTPSQRQDTRARPYADPYVNDLIDDQDIESDISAWEVDERVKQLLYEDDISSYGAHAISSREYQTSEGISDYYDVIMSNEYADSVNVRDIRDIADAVSVSSGSIMSYIDWDAVDQLIGTS